MYSTVKKTHQFICSTGNAYDVISYRRLSGPRAPQYFGQVYASDGRNGIRTAWEVERATDQNDYYWDQTITPCVCISALCVRVCVCVAIDVWLCDYSRV